jgi:biopolymer transport protein ExbD
VVELASRGAEINITPLVDVVLVLLIIFMVVTPLIDRKIEVRVPDDDIGVTPPPADTIVVSVASDGRISINSSPIADGEYVAALAEVLDGRASGARLVFFTADDRASYARVVSALDGARQAGADVLGMATEKLAAAR